MDNPSNDLSSPDTSATSTGETYLPTNSKTKNITKDPRTDSFEQRKHSESNDLQQFNMKTSALKELKREYTEKETPGRIMPNDYLPLLSIPDVALEKILSYLSYDQVAQMRIISKRMNWACQTHLNRGFRAAEQFHAKCLRDVRAKLPRRESSRREHPYSRHCDILTAIGTRISLLAMTFCKFIDVELSCFIPGKVIDEIFRVLHICNQKNPPRAFEVLQELRDISSMAMEYFDEKIVPTFKINPHNPIAGTASMVNACDLHGSSSMSPSKILSGAFMPIAGPSYLGVPAGVSSPVFGTVHSTPKGQFQTYADKPFLLKRFNENNINKSIENPHSDEKSTIDCLNKSHRLLEATIKRQRRVLKKMQKEMKLQREKIEGLEKTINSQDILIVSQAEKLKEHDNMFVEISKQPKEQIQIDLSTCDNKMLTRPIKCENYNSKQNSSYIPQFIIEPPSRDKNNIRDQHRDEENVVKLQTISTKRKLPGTKEDQTTDCKRKRISKFEESELSIIRCGALAAIANKKK